MSSATCQRIAAEREAILTEIQEARNMEASHVAAVWDQEAEVWAVADSDIPGLAMEASSWPAFVENVRAFASMLLRENASAPPPPAP